MMPPPGMTLPPGAYFDPRGFNYFPVPPGLPPTNYFPDGPVASLGDQMQTGTDPGHGTSELEADDDILLDSLEQALLASIEVCETNPLKA